MNMLFGEYLVENKLVSADRLLAGLIWQYEKQASVFRVLAETQVLSKQQILQLAKVHWETSKDVISIGKELSFFDEPQVRFIVDRQRQSRQMIGEVLVEIGALTKSELQEYLTRYRDFLKGNKISKLPSPALETNHLDDFQIEEIQNEFNQLQWHEIESSMAHEYSEFLDANRVGELEAYLLNWEKDRKPDALRSFFRELHTLKGTARFVKAFLSEKLIHKMEELVSDMIRVSSLIPDESASKYVDILLKGLDVLIEIKNDLVHSLNENDFYQIESNRKIILTYFAKLSSLLDSCKTFENNIDLEKFESQF